MYRLILISTLTLYLLTLSVQAGKHSATSIVLSTVEISAIGKEYAERVMKVKSRAHQASASTTAQASASPKIVDQKLKNCIISARPLYNATLDALTSHTPKIGVKPRIVLLVGENTNGGYGDEAAEIFAKNNYQVTLAVIPRYKSELLKMEEADEMWEKHLQSKKNKENITVKDFSKYSESVAATEAINVYRKQLMEEYKDILNTDFPFEDQVETVQNSSESYAAKTLRQNLETLLIYETLALTKFLDDLELKTCVAIDCIVAAGYQSPDEIAQRYVIRYNLAEAINRYLNRRKLRNGVVTGSYEALSNTTTTHGCYHADKDGNMTLIPDSHIPDFMVLITYPRESIMALWRAGPSKAGSASGSSAYPWTGGKVSGPPADPSSTYQYERTKLYVTVYIDPDHPDVSMAECIETVIQKCKSTNTQPTNNVQILEAYIMALKGAENEYKTSKFENGGFLNANLPGVVAAS